MKCPTCKREVATRPELDGFGRPTDRLRFQTHAGSRWGRICKDSGALVEASAMHTQVSRRFFTVWDFRSVDGKQSERVVRVAEPNDHSVQHEYQRIVGQVLAFTPAEALALVNSGKKT